MIQQLTMNRFVTDQAEFIHQRHDPSAEQVRPHTIDEDARGQRVLAGGDPARHLQSATCRRGNVRQLRKSGNVDVTAWRSDVARGRPGRPPTCGNFRIRSSISCLKSCQFTAVSVTASGMAVVVDITCSLLPQRPQSVGFGPVFVLPTGL